MIQQRLKILGWTAALVLALYQVPWGQEAGAGFSCGPLGPVPAIQLMTDPSQAGSLNRDTSGTEKAPPGDFNLIGLSKGTLQIEMGTGSVAVPLTTITILPCPTTAGQQCVRLANCTWINDPATLDLIAGAWSFYGVANRGIWSLPQVDSSHNPINW